MSQGHPLSWGTPCPGAPLGSTPEPNAAPPAATRHHRQVARARRGMQLCCGSLFPRMEPGLDQLLVPASRPSPSKWGDPAPGWGTVRAVPKGSGLQTLHLLGQDALSSHPALQPRFWTQQGGQRPEPLQVTQEPSWAVCTPLKGLPQRGRPSIQASWFQMGGGQN